MNIRNKIVSLILISLIAMSCKNENSKLSEHFSKEETYFLNELVRYYKQSICNEDFNSVCFTKYLNSIRDSLKNEVGFATNYNIEHLRQIIDKHSNSGSKNIFRKSCRVRDIENGLSLNYYCLSPKGPHINFLKDIGENSNPISTYTKKIEEVGDISLNDIYNVILNYEQYDFHKSDNFILLVLHTTHLEMRWNAYEEIEKK